MKDQNRTKKQLIDELAGLRRRINKLEKLELKRKLAEDALRHEHDLMSCIMETSPVGITVVNRDGYITFANARAEQVLGLTRDEVTQRTYDASAWRITDYDGNPFPERELPFCRVMATGRPVFDVRHAIEWPDGRRVLLSINASPLFDESDQRDGMVATVEEITQRIQAEEMLLRREKEIRMIADNVPALFSYVDKEGRYRFVNKQYEEWFGLPQKEIIGKHSSQILGEATHELIKHHVETALSGHRVHYEEVLPYKSGGTRWVAAEYVPDVDERGAVNGFYALVTDITKRKQAEKELEAARMLLEKTFESLDDAVFVIDPSSRSVIACNSAVERVFGYKTQEVLGKITEFLHVDRGHFDKFGEGANLALEKNGRYQTEYEMKRRDGGIFRTENTVTLIRDDFGGWKGSVSVVRDITERKQMEEALRESEEKYRRLFELESDAIFLVDNEAGQILDLNTATLALYGYSREELIGKKNSDLSAEPEETRKVTQTTPVKVDKVVSVPLRFHRKKDGTVFPVEITGRFFDWRGRSVHIAAIRDITERKRAEEKLKESEERFRLAFENANIGMCLVDLQGRLMKVNRQMCEIFGYSQKELENMTVNDIAHPEDTNISPTFIQRAKSGEVDHASFEKRYLHRQGRIVWGQVSSSLVRDAKGVPQYFISHVQDITERRQAEEDRKNLEIRIQRMEKMEALGTLAGGVAHDLNNILSGIVGYPDLILMQLPDDSPLRESILAIKRSGQKAAAVVQDLLTLARRGIVSMEVMNWNSVISDYMKSPEQEKIQSLHPNVRFEVLLEPDLLPIKGSRVHLSKAMMNLISNAAEAIPERGVVTISTKNQYLDQPIKGYDNVKEGDYVVLEVSDTGRGISTEEMGKIFEPFYTKKVMGRSGTGLGLAVVWGTVKDHHGYIDVESEEGRGTAFKVYFSVTREALTSYQAPISLSDYMGKGETILVVDDVREQRELVVAMLSKLNYRVTSVSSGEAGIEYMKIRQADLLILDMIMDPGIDGLETYRRILELRPGQKAIIASGFSETERVRQALDLGAGAFVKKPYVLEKIGVLVRQELDKCALSACHDSPSRLNALEGEDP
jgi:PAS domain S-box-containing protein